MRKLLSIIPGEGWAGIIIMGLMFLALYIGMGIYNQRVAERTMNNVFDTLQRECEKLEHCGPRKKYPPSRLYKKDVPERSELDAGWGT